MNTMQITSGAAAGPREREQKYLTFWTAGQLFGIPIAHVEQIIGLQEIVEVPHLPAYAKGIIHLRGQIIPVIDMRLRMGRPEQAYTSRTSIVVTDVEEQLIGFVVDSVDGVIDIGEDRISPPPRIQQQEEDGTYMAGVACLPGERGTQIVLLLDLPRILSGAERESLRQFG